MPPRSRRRRPEAAGRRRPAGESPPPAAPTPPSAGHRGRARRRAAAARTRPCCSRWSRSSSSSSSAASSGPDAGGRRPAPRTSSRVHRRMQRHGRGSPSARPSPDHPEALTMSGRYIARKLARGARHDRRDRHPQLRPVPDDARLAGAGDRRTRTSPPEIAAADAGHVGPRQAAVPRPARRRTSARPSRATSATRSSTAASPSSRSWSTRPARRSSSSGSARSIAIVVGLWLGAYVGLETRRRDRPRRQRRSA